MDLVKVFTVEADLAECGGGGRGRRRRLVGTLLCKQWLYYPVSQTPLIATHHPTLPVNIQCVTKIFVQDIHKKLYQFNIQCVTKYQFNIQCVTKVFVQDIHKIISPQKWYLLNLKIKTSLVLNYRAGRYASLQ